MTPSEFDGLINRHTAESTLELCPEFRVREAMSLVPLWEETERLVQHEVDPPFWGWSWPGSQALARFVTDAPQWVRAKSVLDLGCGNGLSALAALKAGARAVLGNDVDSLALQMSRLHAELNGFSLDLDRRDLLDSDPNVLPFEVVLVGDLFYARGLARRVAGWLERASRQGATVLVGDPGRAYLPIDRFDVLDAYDVPVSLEVETVEVRHSRVLCYRVTADSEIEQ